MSAVKSGILSVAVQDSMSRPCLVSGWQHGAKTDNSNNFAVLQASDGCAAADSVCFCFALLYRRAFLTMIVSGTTFVPFVSWIHYAMSVGLVSLITFQRRMVNRGLYTSTGMLSRDVVDDDAARISGLQIVIVFRLRLTELFAFRRFLEILFYVTGTVMQCS